MTTGTSPFVSVFGSEAICCGMTLPEAYHFALLTLHDHGINTDCPDWNTTQKELSMTMIVEEPLKEPMISMCIPCGPMELEQYREEILYGVMNAGVWMKKWDYTYNMRMRDWGVKPETNIYTGLDQFRFVIEELERNPDSRRAVMDIRDNTQDMGSNDPACLQHIQFFIRDKKLHMKVLFRSNDAVKATFMNAFALICMQKEVLDTLRRKGMDISMGTYTHRANSFHAYERDFGVLEGYIRRIRGYYDGRFDSPSAYFSGDWENMMREARPKIQKKVDELEARNSDAT